MYNVSRYVTCVKYSTVDEIWSITEEAVTHQASVMHEFQVLVILGWLVAMALGSWALLSPWHLARRDYVYDAEEATSYNVISPVLSALALCWLIFACYTNHGGLASFFFFSLNYDTFSFLSTSFLFAGILNRFLSSYWLLVFSRISYAIYLTQFAVFFYNVGTTRYSSEFQLHTSVRSNSKRTFWSGKASQFRVFL